MAKVTLDRLSKRFKDVRAVDELSLEIADGSFVTLVGPSGCGKSTTLYCIAGLEEPSGGRILFDDRVVNEMSPRDRNIAMVFQDYALYPHMTVHDNIAFALKMRSMSADEVRRRIDEVAEVLALSQLLGRRPSQLSGGQRQRVALARAIARDPEVFLMDEPLSNLDAGLRVNTRTEIKRLQRELSTTTIFVTHDQEEAMVLSDKLAVMKDGLVQQFGSPTEVYGRPQNYFVADFIGSPKMNFMPGALEHRDGALWFRGPAVEQALPAGHEGALAAQGGTAISNVILGVRPHDISVRRASSAPSDGWHSGRRTILTEPVGPVTYIDFDLAGQTVRASASPEVQIEQDDLIEFRFNERALHLFNAETGARLTQEKMQ
jgi:multiple sugar transport system ATP-binding protein